MKLCVTAVLWIEFGLAALLSVTTFGTALQKRRPDDPANTALSHDSARSLPAPPSSPRHGQVPDPGSGWNGWLYGGGSLQDFHPRPTGAGRAPEMDQPPPSNSTGNAPCRAAVRRTEPVALTAGRSAPGPLARTPSRPAKLVDAPALAAESRLYDYTQASVGST